MKEMILGIDAGGTHTRAVLFSEEGKRIDHAEMESVHPLQIGIECCAIKLKELIRLFLERHKLHEDELLVGIGLAGYGNAQMRQQIDAAMACHLPCEWYLMNDGEAAYYGAFQDKKGILLIAGTGSIAYTRIDHHFLRCGGFGYQIDDGGSAYWIGKRLLQEFAMQCDGRKKKTSVYDKLMQHFGWQDPYECIAYIQQHHERKDIAALALFAGAEELAQDTAILQIFKEAAEQLAALANCLADKLASKERIPLVCRGGVFKSQERLCKPLNNALHEQIQLQEHAEDALYGCYWYVKKIRYKEET